MSRETNSSSIKLNCPKSALKNANFYIKTQNDYDYGRKRLEEFSHQKKKNITEILKMDQNPKMEDR